jgi:MoaA/NifB/PqqE/SkfB family radical SAM enzyme
MYELTLEITNECPLNCLHCSSRSNEGNKIELGLNKINEVLDVYKPTWVNISGGEPCSRKDLGNILDIIDIYRMRKRLYTTQFFNEFKRLDEIIVSCYSYYNHINKQITQSDYEPFNLIKKYINHGIVPDIHIVASSLNIDHIDETCNELIEIGINKIKILKLVNQGRCVNNNYLEPNDYELMMLYKRLKTNQFVEFGNPFKHDCNAGKEKIVVMSNGNIIPCETFKDGVCKCVKVKCD